MDGIKLLLSAPVLSLFTRAEGELDNLGRALKNFSLTPKCQKSQKHNLCIIIRRTGQSFLTLPNRSKSGKCLLCKDKTIEGTLMLYISTLLIWIHFANAQRCSLHYINSGCSLFSKCSESIPNQGECVPDIAKMFLAFLLFCIFTYVCSFFVCLCGIRRISRSMRGDP